MTRLAAGSRLALVTGAFGFVEAPLERVVDAYADVLGDGSAWRRLPVQGPIGDALERLEPLCVGATAADRHLLAATDGDWVAYFENAVPGDPRLAAAELPERLGCRTLTLYATARDPEEAASPLTHVGFALRGPGRAGMLDAIRVLIVNADEPAPQTYGDPLPFEDTDPRDLRPELGWLARYCRALGLRPFDPAFYLPADAEGILLER